MSDRSLCAKLLPVLCLLMGVASAQEQVIRVQPDARLQVAQMPQGQARVVTGGYEEAIRSLGQVRRLAGSQIRGRPSTTIGNTRIDFRPVLENPGALVNIAGRLRGLPPQLVQVEEDVIEAAEAGNGVVLRSALTYRLRPGACADAKVRSTLSSAGLPCFRRLDERTRTSAFADPKSPRYVASVRDRNRLLAQSQQQLAAVRAEQQKDIATFRAMLQDPRQRAALAGEVGAQELARLEQLDDETLAGEIANSGQTRIEQLAFVPLAMGLKLNQVPSMVALAQKIRLPAPPVEVSHASRRFVFLTGFTLSNNYEWSQRVETTINWCLVSCKKTYHAEVRAGLHYGLGLRFPIRFEGTYSYANSGGKARASFTPAIAAINGAEQDYRDAGLADAKLFGGKEMVAELGAWAELGAHLPILGTKQLRLVDIGKDFTQDLPPPFRGGQFTPPSPGVPMAPLELVYRDLDLLAGYANYGTFGAQLFPAIRAGLVSPKLELGLTDLVAGSATQAITNGVPVNLAVDPADHDASRFRVGHPRYALQFNLTPGVVARMFLDLAVWGMDFELPVWFPQLGLDIPSGGVEFGCHADTICEREFRFTQQGEKSEFMARMEQWGTSFGNEWTGKCGGDKACGMAVDFIRGAVLLEARQRDRDSQLNPGQPPPKFSDFDVRRSQAATEAAAVVRDMELRRTQEAWATLLHDTWTARCLDKRCLDEVQAMVKEYANRFRQLAKQDPDRSEASILGQLGQEYGKKFQALIDASKKRAGS